MKIKTIRFLLAFIVSLSLLWLFPFLVKAADPIEIHSGETMSGDIAINGQMDAYTFQGVTGQGVVIEMAAVNGNLGPAIYLYSPTGVLETQLLSEYTATHIRLENYQLKETGTYTLVAAANMGTFWSKTGEYGLSLVVIGTGVASTSTPAASVTPGLAPTTAPSPTPAAPSLPSDTFTGSVPLPSQVSTDPRVIGTNALLTSLMVVIFYFAAALFNGTFKENYGTIQSWIKRVRASLKLPRLKTDSRPQSARKSTQYLEIIFIVLVTAAINCVIDTSFGFNQSGLIIFTAMVATVIASTYSYNGIRVLIARYRFHIPATIKAYPLAILLAIVFVIISRLIAFHPGFIIGFVGAFTIIPSAVVLDKRQVSIGILWGALGVIFLALVAFLLREPLASMANGFWQSMLDTILVALFVGGLERLLFGLVPATFLDGGTLASWKKLIWFIVFGLVVFLFVHIVVNKSNALTSAVKDMKVISMVCLVAISFILSLLFWLYFRIRAIQNRRRRLHG